MDTVYEYLNDSYTKEFDSKIILIKDKKFIVFNRTFFYPNSGGQPCDLGEINANGKIFKIINVLKKDGILFHEIDSETDFLSHGMIVSCKLDWERRYKLMRSHTAAHILSNVFNSEAGAMITGNQLDIEESRVDFSLENFNKDKIMEYFEIANKIVQQNLEVSSKYMKRTDVEKDPNLCKLAKGLPTNLNQLRIVSIGNIDSQADGGTHVKNTKEIGEIVFTNMKNKGAENKRVYFKLI